MFSNELPLRLASGDVFVKPDITLLDGSWVHFEDGTAEDFDVIIYATGYNISFPFFDPDFLPVIDNRVALYKRMFIPGVDDAVFIGFTQALPSLFPYVEVQSRLLGAYLAGRYRLPSVAQMVDTIAVDDAPPEDLLMPIEHGRRMAELLPRACFVEIPDSYTLVPEDQPDALAAAIGSFIAREVS